MSYAVYQIRNTKSGEDHPVSKVTEEDVREIRKQYRNEKVSHSKLSKDYPVGRAAIGRIIRGETWGRILISMRSLKDLKQKLRRKTSKLRSYLVYIQ